MRTLRAATAPQEGVTADSVVCGDDGRGQKPFAEPLYSVAADLGVAPEELVMVGDSAHDIDCGQAAGARMGVGPGTAAGVRAGLAAGAAAGGMYSTAPSAGRGGGVGGVGGAQGFGRGGGLYGAGGVGNHR